MAQLNQVFDAAGMPKAAVVEPPKGVMPQLPIAAPAPARAPETATQPPAPAAPAEAETAPLKVVWMPVVPPPPPAPSYERTFRILLHHPEKTDRFDEIIERESARAGLDPRLVKAIIAAESEFTPTARSPRGAMGLMQLMPDTAQMFVHLPWRGALTNPDINIAAGIGYLAELFQAAWRRFKLKGLAYADAPAWLIQRIIAAYNAGPKFLFRDHFYTQTRNYVRKVMRFYHSKVAEIRLPPAQPRPLPFVAQAGSIY